MDASLLPAAPPVSKVNPVVGWLVCLEGPDRGHDYPLRAGTNAIGRSPSMEVCIALWLDQNAGDQFQGLEIDPGLTFIFTGT